MPPSAQLGGVVPLAAVNVPLPALKLPVPLVVKLTEPVGVLGAPELVSVTVAVQVVPRLTWSGLGLQLTLVLLERCWTVRLAVPELALWSVSPL